MWYSNYSYRSRISRYRDYTFGCYGLDEWETYTGYDTLGVEKTPKDPSKTVSAPKEGIRRLMWLDDGDYVITDDGEMMPCDYGTLLIDETGTVYLYDWDADCAEQVPAFRPFNAEGLPRRFDDELAEDMYVVL